MRASTARLVLVAFCLLSCHIALAQPTPTPVGCVPYQSVEQTALVPVGAGYINFRLMQVNITTKAPGNWFKNYLFGDRGTKQVVGAISATSTGVSPGDTQTYSLPIDCFAAKPGMPYGTQSAMFCYSPIPVQGTQGLKLDVRLLLTKQRDPVLSKLLTVLTGVASDASSSAAKMTQIATANSILNQMYDALSSPVASVATTTSIAPSNPNPAVEQQFSRYVLVVDPAYPLLVKSPSQKVPWSQWPQHLDPPTAADPHLRWKDTQLPVDGASFIVLELSTEQLSFPTELQWLNNGGALRATVNASYRDPMIGAIDIAGNNAEKEKQRILWGKELAQYLDAQHVYLCKADRVAIVSYTLNQATQTLNAGKEPTETLPSMSLKDVVGVCGPK